MKYCITILFLVVATGVFAQQTENPLLGRKFWSPTTTVADVKAMVEKGYDPTDINTHNFDVMSYAILENVPLDVCEYLLSFDKNAVDRPTHDGRNYLMWAAYKANVPLMKRLIELGSRTDILDNHGYNYLTFPAVAGVTDPEVYDLILQSDIDIKSTNRKGADALLLLSGHLKDDKMIKYFEDKGLSIRSTDDDGNNAFMYAAGRGNVDMMDYYKSLGLAYNFKNDKGENAIIMASRGGRGVKNGLEVFSYLEDLGIATNIRSKSNNTPLHGFSVVSQKDTNLINYFLNHGVDFYEVNEDGRTFFLNTVARRNYDLAKHYLPKVTNINHQDSKGYSALTYALRSKSGEMVDLLLNKGADLNVRDAKGNDLAYHLFDSYRSEKDNEFFENYILELESNGINFSRKQGEGSTILHVAVEKGIPHLIKKALTLGIDVNVKNGEDLTPLHIAAMRANDSSILKLLLQHGADRSITTSLDETVYDLAKENELLSEKATDINFLKL